MTQNETREKYCREWEQIFPYGKCRDYGEQNCPVVCNYAIKQKSLEGNITQGK